jgi:hypothetical protein
MMRAIISWLLGILVFGLTVGCSFEVDRSEPTEEEGEQVIWDLTTTPSVADLEGSLGREAILSVLGSNGIELRLVLPGGDIVELPWATAVASSDLSGQVDQVDLSTTAETDPDMWNARIDEFVERYGGDRAEIGEWLDAAILAVASGETVTGRNFEGDPQPTYRPQLSVRPGGDSDSASVFVGWLFDLTA